jgi:hypothetical protein
MCPRQFACRRPMLDPLAPLALATARSALVLVRAPTASRRREAVGSIGRVQHRGSTSPGPRWRLPDGRREAMRVAPPLAAASPGIAEASVRLGVTLATDDDQQSAAASCWLLLSRHCDHARVEDVAVASGATRKSDHLCGDSRVGPLPAALKAPSTPASRPSVLTISCGAASGSSLKARVRLQLPAHRPDLRNAREASARARSQNTCLDH